MKAHIVSVGSTVIVRSDGHHTIMEVHPRWRVLSVWAQTHPWSCELSEEICGHVDHTRYPMVGDPCAACDLPLEKDVPCFATSELPVTANGRQPWVCGRHAPRGLR